METKLSLLSAQLDHIAELISYLEDQKTKFVCEPVLEELQTAINLLKKKVLKIQKEYDIAYNEWLEFSDFLGSLEF